MSISIMVTGASGFVGSNFKNYTKELDYKVTPVSIRNGVDSTMLNNQQVILHLAGKAHDLKKTSNDKEYFDVNAELTKKLFDAFLVSDATIFVFMSSVKAAADFVEGILKEDVEPTPITPYGKSKLEAENYVLKQELPEGKYIYILRPCMIHGEGNKGNLNLLYQLVKRNIPYPLGSFVNKRSFLSVENLCFLILKLIEKKPESGIYNISDDEAISTVDLIRIISEALGKKPKVLHISKGVIKKTAKLGDLFKLPLNTERLTKLTENYQVSNSKIKEVLLTELPITTREGLSKTIKSFKNM